MPCGGEIHLTKESVDHPNWIDTSEGIRSILVRQYIGDREKEVEATYEIEVVGREPYEDLPYSTDAEVAQRIAGTEYGFRFVSSMHRTILPKMFDQPNQFVRSNSDDFGADISSPGNLYLLGTYAVAEDEALIVEVEPLDVRFWNLAIESPWHESVDYAKRKGSRTHDDVTTDPDGMVRFLVAHARSDHPNYLETAGHSRGFMTFRWGGERDTTPPLPKVTRLPLGEAVARANRLAAGRSPTGDPN